MNTTSSARFDYSSESTNDTSLIAKSMSWNYSGAEVDNARPGEEEDNAGKGDNGGIGNMKESKSIANITGNKGIKDGENIAKRDEVEETANRKDNERTADNERLPEEADNDREKGEDHVTGSTTDTSESHEAGHVLPLNHRSGLPQSASDGRRQRKQPVVRVRDDSNLRRTVELAAAQSAKPRGLSLHQSDKSSSHENGKATVTRCILVTSRFIWLPICQPNRGCRHSDVMDEALVAAAECVRWHLRRNALCDHMAMPMTQETRERIERDVADRKTSVTRKVSQYLKAAFNSSNYDVDLI